MLVGERIGRFDRPEGCRREAKQGGEAPVQLQGIHAAAPNLCCVCVDRVEKDECRGRLFHYYAGEALPFLNQYELVMAIDALCDKLGYPQAAEQPRSFGRNSLPATRKEEVTRLKSKEDIAEQKGMMATFLVHVMHRQNATWQGTVVWAEKNQKASFRSALELVKLMDGAVEESIPEAHTAPTLTDNDHDLCVEE